MECKKTVGWLARPPLGWTLLACAVILGARRPDLFYSPQFWAEDGTVFFQQAQTMGAAALWEPSAGYLHTVLRLVAWLAAWCDPALAPALYIAAAGGLTLYVAARTQSVRFPLSPSIGYAMAVVLVPDAFEVLLNLTNVQWVLAGGLLLVLIAREPERPGQRVHDIGAVLLLGLTGPFVIALVPLFGWRAWQRRTQFSLWLAVLAMMTAGVQAALILRGGMGAKDSVVATHLLLALPGVRVGGSLLSGGHWNADIGVPFASVLGVVTLVGVAALAAAPGRARLERTWLALAFGAMLGIALFRCRHFLPTLFHGAGPRYFFPLQTIALWLLVAVATGAPRVAAWTAGVVLAVVLGANLPRLREPTFTDFNWPEYAARIRQGERVEVPINPDWTFTVPGKDIGRVSSVVRDAPSAGLVNLSIRCHVAAGKPALAGFTVRSGAERMFLVRAIGPSLAKFGVRTALARPTLILLQGGETDMQFQPQRNGSEDPELVQATKACRAFALEPGTGDLAGLVRLSPGVYSMIVSTEENDGGEVLLEVYELPSDWRSAPGR